jgi:hypothetical protein
MSIFEQLFFLGYTSVHPIYIIIFLISIFGLFGELYLQAFIIKPSLKRILPQSLIVVIIGVIQSLMIPLIAQHTLTFHLQLVWAYIALFFALLFQIDCIHILQYTRHKKLKIFMYSFTIILYIFVTFSLFYRPAFLLRASIPAILWGYQFLPILTFSRLYKLQRTLRRYLQGVYISALTLAVWTFLQFL